MRIRKRKVPFPISSLSPVPISDPLSARPVQLHLEDDADDYYDPRPADQPAAPDGRDSSAEGDNKEDEVLWGEAGREKIIIINNNSTGKGSPSPSPSPSPSNVGALIENMILQQPAGSSALEEKVAEKCKAEVKKKVSNRKNTERHNGYAKEENDQSFGDSIRSDDRELDSVAGGGATFTASCINSGDAAAAASGKKGRGRSGGAVLMEGSRCSRVNGRGWRCCQQTLVGYSLCEHHLGKGRLRSMSNVRSSRANDDNVAQKKNKAVTQMPLSNYGQEAPKASSRSGDEHGGLGEKVPAAASMSRRRTKLGVVKARSMSSLLGQQNEASDHDQV